MPKRTAPAPAGRSLPPLFTPAASESYWVWQQSRSSSDWESLDSVDSGESGYTPVGVVIMGVEVLISFFEWLFGNGPSLPPNYFVFQARLQRGKRHPLYTSFDGLPIDIVLNEAPAAPTLSAIQGPENDPPLAKDPAPNLDKFVWYYSHVVHPLDLLAANGAAFATGVVLAAAGLAEIAAACINPTPVEPLTCAAGAVAGGLTFGVGASAVGAAAYGFAKITLPAIKESWGLP